MKKILLPAAAAVYLLCASFYTCARADIPYSISFESKEVVYDVSKKTMMSDLRGVVMLSNVEISADRFLFDIGSNTLRASGDVVLKYNRLFEQDFYEVGTRDAKLKEYLTGAEVQVNAALGEAIVFSKGGKKELAVDLNMGRIIPSSKIGWTPPDFYPAPDKNVVLCFEANYSSDGGITMNDATYFAPDGSQHYTASLIASNPSLVKKTLVGNSVTTRKSFIWSPSGEMRRNTSGTADASMWVSNEPRATTIVALSEYVSDFEGFKVFTPRIFQNLSVSNVSLTGELSRSETSEGASLSASMFTKGRSKISGGYDRRIEDGYNESNMTATAYKPTTVYLSGQIWRERYKIDLNRTNTRYTTDNRYDYYGTDWNWSGKVENTSLSFSHEPVPLISGISLGIEANADKLEYHGRESITAPDVFTQDISDSEDLSIAPYLITGPRNIGNGITLTAGVEYEAAFMDDRYNQLDYNAGSVLQNTDTKNKYSEYAYHARVRMSKPLGTSTAAELVSENSKENGVESNILTPGVSYSYNGRDYVFVGAAYDFGASEWNTLDMDYIYRAGDGLRFVYSMRRDLMNDVFTAQTFNLQADFFKGTFILGFEDESSEFWAGYFLDNKMGTSGRSLFSRWNGGSR